MADKDQRDAREADVARRDRRRAEPEEGSVDPRHEPVDGFLRSEGIRFLEAALRTKAVGIRRQAGRGTDGVARGSSSTRSGSVSSPCCRRWSGASATRAASACPTGRHCRGSVRAAHRGRPAAFAARARFRLRLDLLEVTSGPRLMVIKRNRGASFQAIPLGELSRRGDSNPGPHHYEVFSPASLGRMVEPNVSQHPLRVPPVYQSVRRR
jgi:hypothetical protein